MFGRFLNSKDRRGLVENFLSLSSLQLIGLILPLVTLPYVLRTIGLEKFGIISLAWALINYFNSVTDYSYRITATRDVAIFKDSPKKLDLIYSKVMIVQTLLQFLSYLIIFLVIYLYKPFYDERLIFFLTVPYLFGNTIFPDWFFQGIEKMKYITLINLSVKIFFTLFVFVLIKRPADYWIYPLLQTTGFVMAGLFGQLIIIRKYKIKFILLKPKRIKESLKSNFPIFANQFLPNLYNNSSTFLLGILTNNTLVGVYAAIRRITNLCFMFMNIVSRVFFPFISRKKNAFHKYRNIMLSLGIFLCISPILCSELIFWYLDIHTSYAFLVLVILCLGLFFIAIYDIYGINYFIVHRQDKLVMKNTFVASILGFILAFPLIHFFGIIGAALDLALSQLLMGGGIYLKYRKFRHLFKN